MGIDYADVRNRLLDLKNSSNLKNYEFCEIYNPDKCDKTENNANNYISAIFSGRNYPNTTSGSAKIELEHLQNLVDSDIFPGLTMNYLLYGKDEFVTEKIVKDLDYHNWTLADFFEFLFGLLQEYANEIKYTVSEEETIESIDSIYQGTAYYSTLKFFVRETLADEGCDLGLALQLFLQEYQICCNYHHDDLRKEAFNKMLNTIKSDKRFSETYLDKCHDDNNFLEFSDDGEQESIKIREIGQDQNPGSV